MPIWKIDNWTKFFGKTGALQGVTLHLTPNTVYGLVGPNGSGKSTLVKAITGVLRLDSGKFYKDDKEIKLHSPLEAYKNGICAAYQELSLIPHLTVRENLSIVARMRQRFFGVREADALKELVNTLLLLRPDIDLDTEVRRLPRTEQQLIEIAKAIGYNPQLLLLDEPTSFLNDKDIEVLFSLITKFKKESTVVFVSHRLREVTQICDEVIVLKDGKLVGNFSPRETSVDQILHAMGAASLSLKSAIIMRASYHETKDVFFLANVKTEKVKDVELVVEKGEIVGLAGLVGHGQSDLLRAIFGLIPCRKKIVLDGRSVTINSPRDAIREGIIYVSGTPSDVVFPHRSVRENIALLMNSKSFPFKLVDTRAEAGLARLMVTKLGIVCRTINEPIRTLSGGNQQKSVLARALSAQPRVLLLDDPLKGIDTITKQQLYQFLLELAERTAIIFFASDVDELLPVCTRVLVMYEGRIVAEFSGESLTRENILAAALHGGSL